MHWYFDELKSADLSKAEQPTSCLVQAPWRLRKHRTAKSSRLPRARFDEMWLCQREVYRTCSNKTHHLFERRIHPDCFNSTIGFNYIVGFSLECTHQPPQLPKDPLCLWHKPKNSRCCSIDFGQVGSKMKQIWIDLGSQLLFRVAGVFRDSQLWNSESMYKHLAPSLRMKQREKKSSKTSQNPHLSEISLTYAAVKYLTARPWHSLQNSSLYQKTTSRRSGASIHKGLYR